MDNPDNGGLSDLVDELEALYQEEGYSTLISRSTCMQFITIIKKSHILPNRADFWALAGIIAVDKGIENANEDCDSDDCAVPDSGLAFQWGRQVSDNILSIIVHSIVTCFWLKDCSTSPDTTDDVGLPGSTLDHDGVMDFFATG